MPHSRNVEKLISQAPEEKQDLIRGLLRRMGASKDETDHNQDMPESSELEHEDLNHEHKKATVRFRDHPQNPLRNIQLPPNTIV